MNFIKTFWLKKSSKSFFLNFFASFSLSTLFFLFLLLFFLLSSSSSSFQLCGWTHSWAPNIQLCPECILCAAARPWGRGRLWRKTAEKTYFYTFVLGHPRRLPFSSSCPPLSSWSSLPWTCSAAVAQFALVSKTKVLPQSAFSLLFPLLTLSWSRLVTAVSGWRKSAWNTEKNVPKKCALFWTAAAVSLLFSSSLSPPSTSPWAGFKQSVGGGEVFPHCGGITLT